MTTERNIEDLSSLLVDLYRWLPGAYEGDLRATLRDVACTFCRETGVLTEKMDPIDIVAGTTDYQIVPPYAVFVSHIKEAWRGTATASESYLSGQSTPSLISPRQYAFIDGDPAIFQFIKAPSMSQTGGLTLVVAMIPLADCEEFPERFLSRWRQVLVAGVIARMAGIEDKPYFNRGIQASFAYDYKQGLSEARTHDLTGGRTGSLSMQNSTPWI